MAARWMVSPCFTKFQSMELLEASHGSPTSRVAKTHPLPAGGAIIHVRVTSWLVGWLEAAHEGGLRSANGRGHHHLQNSVMCRHSEPYIYVQGSESWRRFHAKQSLTMSSCFCFQCWPWAWSFLVLVCWGLQLPTCFAPPTFVKRTDSHDKSPGDGSNPNEFVWFSAISGAHLGCEVVSLLIKPAQRTCFNKHNSHYELFILVLTSP